MKPYSKGFSFALAILVVGVSANFILAKALPTYSPNELVFEAHNYNYELSPGMDPDTFELAGGEEAARNYIIYGIGALPLEVVSWQYNGGVETRYMYSSATTGVQRFEMLILEDQLADLQEIRIYKNGALVRTISQSEAVQNGNRWEVSTTFNIDPNVAIPDLRVEWDSLDGIVRMEIP